MKALLWFLMMSPYAQAGEVDQSITRMQTAQGASEGLQWILEIERGLKHDKTLAQRRLIHPEKKAFMQAICQTLERVSRTGIPGASNWKYDMDTSILKTYFEQAKNTDNTDYEVNRAVVYTTQEQLTFFSMGFIVGSGLLFVGNKLLK